MLEDLFKSSDFWVATSFVLLCIFGAKPALRSARQNLVAYSRKVTGDFERLEAALYKATTLYKKAEEEHQEVLLREREILELADESIALLKKQYQEDTRSAWRQQEEFVEQRARLIERQIQISIYDFLVSEVLRETREYFPNAECAA